MTLLHCTRFCAFGSLTPQFLSKEVRVFPRKFFYGGDFFQHFKTRYYGGDPITYMYPFSDGCTLFRTVPYDFDNHFFFNHLSPWDPESLFQSSMSHILCHYLLFCHFHFNDNFLYMGKKLRFFQNFRFEGKVHCCS